MAGLEAPFAVGAHPDVGVAAAEDGAGSGGVADGADAFLAHDDHGVVAVGAHEFDVLVEPVVADDSGVDAVHDAFAIGQDGIGGIVDDEVFGEERFEGLDVVCDERRAHLGLFLADGLFGRGLGQQGGGEKGEKEGEQGGGMFHGALLCWVSRPFKLLCTRNGIPGERKTVY